MYYYYYPYYYPYIPAPSQPWSLTGSPRQFPAVDTQQFDTSIHKFQMLMRQANLLINKLADDPEFAKELMGAAQQSNENKVNELIKSTGVTINVKTSFTPTGIRIILNNSELAGGCCNLLVWLRW